MVWRNFPFHSSFSTANLVALTAYGRAEDRLRALTAGLNMHCA